MKKMITVTVILFVSAALSAQPSLNSSYNSNRTSGINSTYKEMNHGLMSTVASSESSLVPSIDYLKRSKAQVVTGCILAAAGVITLGVVLANDINNLLTDESSPTGLYVAGVAAIGTGIVLFIAAAKNKKRAAASVSLKREKIKVIPLSNGRNQSYPAMALKITF